MNIELSDGRSELWQWDTGRRLRVYDDSVKQLHFQNRNTYDTTVDVDVVDGFAAIPDELLWSCSPLKVFAFVGSVSEGYTKVETTFTVNVRNKPADYVYTPTEKMTFEQILDIIGSLDELKTEDKTSLVAAINETSELKDMLNDVLGAVGDVIGDPEELATEDKSNLVAAINELVERPVTASVQPDMAQNDETQPDYVKSRTHWKEESEDGTETIYHKLDNGYLNLDKTPTEGSGNPVTSGGVLDALNGKVDSIDGKGLSTNDYTDEEKEKLAGVEAGANKYTHPATHSADMITGLPTTLPANGGNADTVDNRHASDFATADHTHSDYATKTEVSALETELDGKSEKEHTHTQDNITGLAEALNGKAEKAHTHEISDVTGLSDSLSAIDNKADLVDGKVPSSQLPAAVDEVVEAYIVAGATAFSSGWLSATEGGEALTPQSNTVYIVVTSGEYENITYRWGSTMYVPIKGDIALGETESTAYRGDRGKAAYDHSQNAEVHVTADEKATWNAKQDALTFDAEPTAGSNKPVTSNGISDAISNLSNDISGVQGNIDSLAKVAKTGSYNDLVGKTHWKETQYAEGDVVFDKTITTDGDGVYGETTPLENIAVGDTVIVEWDGTAYECEVAEKTLFDDYTEVVIGSMKPFDESYTGTEPFFILPFVDLELNSGMGVQVLGGEGTYTVKITKGGGEATTTIHKLDSEYLNLDDTPTENSTNPLSSGGAYTALKGKSEKDHTHDTATTEADGFLSKSDKTKLDGIAEGANKTTVDSVLSSSSENPVQNKVINTALGNKVDKVSGKGLSTNDYTTAEKTKLSGIETGANKYTHPDTHPASMITGLATVATSGSYNDLSNKPTIPTSLPANGGNADTVNGYKIVVSDTVPTVDDKTVITFVVG